jgi:hypothetical protein
MARLLQSHGADKERLMKSRNVGLSMFITLLVTLLATLSVTGCGGDLVGQDHRALIKKPPIGGGGEDPIVIDPICTATPPSTTTPWTPSSSTSTTHTWAALAPEARPPTSRAGLRAPALGPSKARLPRAAGGPPRLPDLRKSRHLQGKRRLTGLLVPLVRPSVRPSEHRRGVRLDQRQHRCSGLQRGGQRLLLHLPPGERHLRLPRHPCVRL